MLPGIANTNDSNKPVLTVATDVPQPRRDCHRQGPQYTEHVIGATGRKLLPKTSPVQYMFPTMMQMVIFQQRIQPKNQRFLLHRRINRCQALSDVESRRLPLLVVLVPPLVAKICFPSCIKKDLLRQRVPDIVEHLTKEPERHVPRSHGGARRAEKPHHATTVLIRRTEKSHPLREKAQTVK